MFYLLFAAASSEPDPAKAAMGGAILLCLAVLGFVIYFLPTMIAFGRGHPNAAAIFMLDILLGWTFLGWCIALVWSFTAVQRRYQTRQRYASDQEWPG